MIPLNISNATDILVAPENWDSRNGVCQALAVIREDELIYSFWKPSWKERIKILFGKPIQLSIVSVNQPPVALEVL